MLHVMQIPTEPVMPPPWVTLPPPAVVAVMLVMVGGAVLILWPLVRALARRLEGGGPRLERRVEELERRLAQVETRAPVTGEVDLTYQRLHELEDRVGFAERLLAQQRSPGQLGAGGDR